MSHLSPGIVYLVGAGPGDVGLITVRGRDLLEQADVVVYDYLSNPLLLGHAPQARAIYVGKKAAQHSMTQDEINALLVREGLAGHKVVRLKGGDPFVFGRGGEECEALHNAGVPFEVVPGITAAIAAPAYAGIPVTHRDFNSSFTFITGHEKEEQYKEDEARTREGGAASDVDWPSLAKLPCLAFYMGVKSLPRICQRLIENGMPPDMPAATIRWGTHPKQRTVVGTIADLPQKIAEAKLGPPAMTIIGRVVSLRPVMNWFESRPLFGQTVVVTRTRQQASDLSKQLSALGANVLEAPTIELAPPADLIPVDAALKSIGTYDWTVFTSANGVRYVKQRLLEIGLDARAFGRSKLAAIGDATAAAIREELSLKVDLCPQAFVAEALADALRDANEVKGKRHLLLRADIARPVLRQRLSADGSLEVSDVAVYETRPAAALPPTLIDALAAGDVQWVTFTSSSTAKNFVALLGDDYKAKLAGVKIASIGPITTATLKDLGLEPTVQAETFNLQGLLSALK
ncbi:uroporphyrinogen-III C-methyltransferase [Humisphaera borealis]|uniref:uroporphyrinogen-III C-methyltransferase n=1 Tax=Humisphaera borealis TaxID=2807512 RepID=A0A7M2WPB3_9BACT|nr:uroporphyrinogen-III C-methyltransferase [Humisphaera borealis]QOV87306.1 uroporphyrinogen-III C-methyltransferase [Humisphaera borealis]